MSYDAIMSKALDVQEAAAQAALRERAQVPWPRANIDPTEFDADTYKSMQFAWPSDPTDTDIIFEIPDKFEWFALRLAGSVTDAKSALEKMSWTIAAVPQNGIGEQQDRLHEFGLRHEGAGKTMETIGAYMISVGNAKSLQLKLRDELVLALDVCQKLLDEAEEKVIEIADDTINCLEGGAGDSSVLLSLISTALGIGAILTTGGLATGFAISSALAGGASSLTGDDKKELPVSGSTVTEILDSMSQALEDVHEQLEEREDEIDTGLRSDLHLLQDKSDHNRFWEMMVPGNVTPKVKMPAPKPTDS